MFPIYEGPLRIIGKPTPNAYELQWEQSGKSAGLANSRMLRPNRVPKLKPEITREPSKEHQRLRDKSTSSETSDSQDWRQIGSPHRQSQARSSQSKANNENSNNSENDDEYESSVDETYPQPTVRLERLRIPTQGIPEVIQNGGGDNHALPTSPKLRRVNDKHENREKNQSTSSEGGKAPEKSPRKSKNKLPTEETQESSSESEINSQKAKMLRKSKRTSPKEQIGKTPTGSIEESRSDSENSDSRTEKIRDDSYGFRPQKPYDATEPESTRQSVEYDTAITISSLSEEEESRIIKTTSNRGRRVLRDTQSPIEVGTTTKLRKNEEIESENDSEKSYEEKQTLKSILTSQNKRKKTVRFAKDDEIIAKAAYGKYNIRGT